MVSASKALQHERQLTRRIEPLYREGIARFNRHSRQGVAFLVEHQFLNGNDAEDVAHFLLNEPDLDRTQIGEYLGSEYVIAVQYCAHILLGSH